MTSLSLRRGLVLTSKANDFVFTNNLYLNVVFVQINVAICCHIYFVLFYCANLLILTLH